MIRMLMNSGYSILPAVFLGLLSCRAIPNSESNDMSFPGTDGCFGIAITAMLRHLTLVENLLETLNAAECSGNRRVVYLTTDALDVYREKLNSSKTLLVF